MIGSTVSRYKVLERLGGGGAGVVYKAEDTKLERLVALKFLSAYRAALEGDKRRFLREARASSSLDHPNICTVYEIDETDDGRLFMAMAFCEGETLKRKVERGPLPLAEAVYLAAQIADGLAAAHAKGIVHRDVKPANVMVAPSGRVKIVDFGIAKLSDQSRLTRDGTAVGTAGYMAPEQLRGDAIDPRADVWALGIVLYEMVTGRVPFPAETDHDRIRGILTRDPEPLQREVPAEIERIVRKALSKKTDDRYLRMEDMRADLVAAAGVLGLPDEQDGFEATLRDIPSSFSRPRYTEEGSPSLAGQTLAHYRIVELMAGGGMGLVYQAQDLRLSRTVALKFLPPELTRDPEAKARFLQEARSASILDHPNICTIHEVGETEDGRLYLAMPFYDGETLRKRIERGPMALDEATDITQQIARGLAKAHRHGIIHRDIKPANVMVTSDGVVKILDFGLAKLAGSAALTRTGSSVGTPAYMSPEQAKGEEVDHRADLWSLGVVLYEMVAGRRPFRGEHEQAVLYSLLNEEPKPLHELRPDVPPELERIVEGLLAKDPDDRYPAVEGPLGDITALRNESMTTTVRTQQEPARRGVPSWVWAVGLALAAALVAGGIWLWEGNRRTGAALSPASNVPLTDLEGSETFPSLSPDGKSFLYVKSRDGNTDIYLQRVGGGNAQNLTDDSLLDDTQPAFSPDGEQIAFHSEREGGGLFLMGATGEPGRRLTSFGFNPAWSADGRQIAFGTEGVSGPLVRKLENSQLWVVDVATGKTRLVTRQDAVQPSWSPNGHRIAYWGVPKGKSQRILFTIPAEGGTPVQVTRDGAINWNPVWAPDGAHLYYISNRSGSMNLWRVALDEKSGRVRGEPEPVTGSFGSLGLLSLSGDGRQIAYATEESKANLERWAFDPARLAVSGSPSAVTQGSRSVRSAAVSPDGEWVAFDVSSPQEDLFVIHRDGSSQRQLTTDASKDRIPRWLADGPRIVFYSDRSGRYKAWTIRADGGELKPVDHGTGEPLYNPIGSPDGQSLVAGLGSRGAVLIHLSLPPGQRIQPLPSPGGRELFSAVSWSADGRHLAGSLEQADGSEIPGIVVYSFETNRYERLTETGQVPVWLHDSRTLLYLQDGRIFRTRLRDKTPRLVLAPPDHSVFNSMTVAPDDRTLFAVRKTDEGDIWMMTLAGGDAEGTPP